MNFIKITGVIAILVAASAVQAQDARTAYNNHCRTCHSLKDGDNRLGPHLFGVIGRKAGSVADYPYSSAFQGAGFVWTVEKMDAFLATPDQVVPGNNMNPYQGLSDPAVRKLIIEAMSGG